MTYKKPQNVTYTQMCKWIDENAYTETCDEVKLYEYLYHIVNMLAVQNCMFKTAKDYDDFSLIGATRLFLRLKNKKQFEGTEITVAKKLKPIKSILNYAKKLIYPMKIDYDRQNNVGADTWDANIEELDNPLNFKYQLMDTIEDTNLVEFVAYFHDIPNTIRAYLKNIPQKKNSSEWDNIYLSCLLSFLNSITLPQGVWDKLSMDKKTLYTKPEVIDKLYQQEKQNCTILYHLPTNMKPYITVLTNKLRRVIARDLSGTLHSYIPTDVGMENLLMGASESDYKDEN